MKGASVNAFWIALAYVFTVGVVGLVLFALFKVLTAGGRHYRHQH